MSAQSAPHQSYLSSFEPKMYSLVSFARMKRILLLLIMSSVDYLAVCRAAPVDVKQILVRAGNLFAEKHGTKIDASALAQGFCFSRTDETTNQIKCIDQPSGNLLELLKQTPFCCVSFPRVFNLVSNASALIS